MMNIFKKTFFSALSIFFLAASTQPLHSQTLPNFVEIVKTEKSKVVHISTTTKVKNNVPNEPIFKFFPRIPRERKETALGSGFFYSPEGYVVTNNHVIKGAETIEIILDDNRSFPAKVVGSDERTDLALLKLEGKGRFPSMKFGDSSKVEIGEWVLAIGNPLGLDQTVTAGIISAKERDILGGTAYGQFIQTDAAINFGNSGGPLLNTKGEVIGINTAIAGGQSLGFAIPSNLAVKVLEQLRKKGSVTRGWLGIGIQDLTPEISSSMKLPNGQRGVLVTQIFPDSPAEKGGLQEQDLIIEINGNPILKTNDLQQFIAELSPDSTIMITMIRNNKKLTKKVQIGEFTPDVVAQTGNSSPVVLGMVLLTVNKEVQKEYNLKVSSGLLVKDIEPSSPLSDKVEAGDVIIKLNGKDMRKVKDFTSIVEPLAAESSFVLLINRDGRQMLVAGTK